MASVRTRERQIGNVEGFDVIVRHPDGRDVRSDLSGLPAYRFERGAKGSMTVADWKGNRFKECYPGFDCDVLDSNGRSVNGNTLLDTVRATYLE